MNKEEAGRNVDPNHTESAKIAVLSINLALHARIGSNQELQNGLEPALQP